MGPFLFTKATTNRNAKGYLIRKLSINQTGNRAGTLTENGKFHQAAQRLKAGEKGPDIVQVYEKIKAGIWTDNGFFHLVDSWVEGDGVRKVGSVTFGVGKGSGPFGSPGTQVWPHRGGGNVARCSAPAASVWTKRGCRERPWGQAGDNSLGFQGVSEICAASCPQLVPTHPPFAHTAPRYPRCGPRTPAAQQQLVL